MGDETVVQMREFKKGVGAAGNVLERYMIRLLGPIGKKITESTKAGRAMALIGVVTILVSLVLIFTDATWFSTSQRKGRQYVNITYEQKGYGLAFVAGVGLYIAGIMQKKSRK
jgi:hypothetical protein